MPRIAFVTIAIQREVDDHPTMQGFVDRIDAGVRTLEQADGFIASDFDQSPHWGEPVWPKIVDRPEFHGKYAYTLSLWQDLDSVFAYAYNAAHGEALRHRAEWFEKGEWPVYAAWWVDDDHIPTLQEAAQRYDQLYELGPTPAAFDFKHPYDADGTPMKIDRERVRDKVSALPTIDWAEATETGRT